MPAAPPLAAPLAGLRVLDISAVLAGPNCARYLADFGADVIKVEHPERGDTLRNMAWRDPRDGEGLWWKVVNRNKRTIALDLKDDADREVFLHLVDGAQVVVENFRPGTLERLGLGPEVLQARNPTVVLTRVTGFGQTGPYAGRAGFATIAESMSGRAVEANKAEAIVDAEDLGCVAGDRRDCALAIESKRRRGRRMPRGWAGAVLQQQQRGGATATWGQRRHAWPRSPHLSHAGHSPDLDDAHCRNFLHRLPQCLQIHPPLHPPLQITAHLTSLLVSRPLLLMPLPPVRLMPPPYTGYISLTRVEIPDLVRR
jgi:hypothetical protein